MMTLKEYLASKPNITRRQFAADIGITQSYLSEIVSGKKAPGAAIIWKIQNQTKGKVTLNDWVGP